MAKRAEGFRKLVDKLIRVSECDGLRYDELPLLVLGRTGFLLAAGAADMPNMQRFGAFLQAACPGCTPPSGGSPGDSIAAVMQAVFGGAPFQAVSVQAAPPALPADISAVAMTRSLEALRAGMPVGLRVCQLRLGAEEATGATLEMVSLAHNPRQLPPSCVLSAATAVGPLAFFGRIAVAGDLVLVYRAGSDAAPAVWRLPRCRFLGAGEQALLPGDVQTLRSAVFHAGGLPEPIAGPS